MKNHPSDYNYLFKIFEINGDDIQVDTVLVCLPPSSGRWGVYFATSLEIWSTSAEPEVRVSWGLEQDFECKKKPQTE